MNRLLRSLRRPEAAEAAEEGPPGLNENLFRSVAELALSMHSASCLQNADIKHIGELVQKREAAMLKTKNFGRKSLNEIREMLREMGLHFDMRTENFPTRLDTSGQARAGADATRVEAPAAARCRMN